MYSKLGATDDFLIFERQNNCFGSDEDDAELSYFSHNIYFYDLPIQVNECLFFFYEMVFFVILSEIRPMMRHAFELLYFDIVG